MSVKEVGLPRKLAASALVLGPGGIRAGACASSAATAVRDDDHAQGASASQWESRPQ